MSGVVEDTANISILLQGPRYICNFDVFSHQCVTTKMADILLLCFLGVSTSLVFLFVSIETSKFIISVNFQVVEARLLCKYAITNMS